MASVKVYNQEGKVVKEESLDPKYFAVKVNPILVQQVVEAQAANSRQVLAHTKDRSEVRGGGKKPWKQKKTGRARHGSRRSPIWVGGGITFGPTKERNFTKKINQQMKLKALFMVLSDKVTHERLVLIDDLNLSEAKTKNVHKLLDNLPLKHRKTLVVLDQKNEGFIRAAKNLPKVNTLPATSLNVIDLLKYEYLLMPVPAVAKIVRHYNQ